MQDVLTRIGAISAKVGRECGTRDGALSFHVGTGVALDSFKIQEDGRVWLLVHQNAFTTTVDELIGLLSRPYYESATLVCTGEKVIAGTRQLIQSTLGKKLRVYADW